jgi:hypothetical protein
MSTLKSDAVTATTTNGDLVISGNGTGVPDIETGFKVGGTAGLPINNLRVGTDGELITWDASGDPAAVAVGTATHVLTSNGAGAAPTFQAAGGGGEWQFAATGTLSSASEIDFTGLTGDTKFVFEDISVGTDNSNIRCLLSNDNGSSFETSYMSFITTWTSNVNATDNWYGSGGFIGLTNGGTGSASGEGTQGWIILHNPQDSGKFTHVNVSWSTDTQSTNLNFSVGSSCRQVAEAIDALRVFPENGTFSGTWYKYTRITS